MGPSYKLPTSAPPTHSLMKPLPANVSPSSLEPVSSDRPWNGGMCDCCYPAGEYNGCALCCVTYKLPCVTFGQTMEKAGFGKCVPKAITYLLVCYGLNFILGNAAAIILGMTTPNNPNYPIVMWLDMAAVLALILCLGLYAGRARGALRRRFGLRGDGCTDCLRHAFCHPCHLCQEHRTIAINVHDGEWTGPVAFVAVPAPSTIAPQVQSIRPTAEGGLEAPLLTKA